STILSTVFIYLSYHLWKAKGYDETVVMAKKVFFFSLFYLSAIFGTLLVESFIRRFIIF
ncbi:MAG: protoheme IX farnesyltransferase, partial [Bartonella sp.]|nr:protoheme IX farnesyltransferase [Bartonella sp.]